ncbi:flagellum-specific ATP synthase FliI, partial [Aeromonas hydrophila]|nr:flagellum-specific ATP synthase FliI [Aeromonas hydrophila]
MSGSLLNRLQGYRVRDIAPKPPVAGKLTRVVGLTLEAIGCRAAIGALCRIDTQDGSLEAEVVGFSGDRLFLMPSEQLKGVIPGARVVPITEEHGIPVGMNLLGRVIDGIGQPLDGLGPILSSQTVQFAQHRINPLSRRPIHQPMDVGVRAINAVLT